MNTLLSRVFTALSIVLLMSGCTIDDDYVDSLEINNFGVNIVSEGEIHDIPFDYFRLTDHLERTANDTILLEDEVKTINTDFAKAECVEVISVLQYGNYTIKRCLYKSSFRVLITSFAHETQYRYLPFYFEADEIWLNGQKVVEQPFVFEKTQTNLTQSASEKK